jgi:hypothetical protein
VLHYKNIFFANTNTNICPAMIRSTKYKYMDKDWIHMAEKYDFNVTHYDNRNEYRDLPGHKGWPAHKADNLTTICEPTV